MRPVELVIFDCDGVLVDSEVIANRVFCEMLNDIGLRVSLPDMFERFVGLSMPQCVELIAEINGRPPPRTFIAELRQRTAAALSQQIKPVAGVTGVLSSLHVPYCVASSGTHEKINLTLGATGLMSYFKGRIFSVADVQNPKPAPDVFLLAAKTLGVDPAACAVVEDTPVGVRAAVAAGMRAIGFAACTPARRLWEAGASEVISEMRQLPGIVRTAGDKAGIRL